MVRLPSHTQEAVPEPEVERSPKGRNSKQRIFSKNETIPLNPYPVVTALGGYCRMVIYYRAIQRDWSG